MKNVLSALPSGINWGNTCLAVLICWAVAHLVTPWAWLVLAPLAVAEGVRLMATVKIAGALREARETQAAAFDAQLAAMTQEAGE